MGSDTPAMQAALEAAAKRIALYNNDYDGPELHWQGYVDEAEEAITAFLKAMEAEGVVLMSVADLTRAMIAAAPALGRPRLRQEADSAKKIGPLTVFSAPRGPDQCRC